MMKWIQQNKIALTVTLVAVALRLLLIIGVAWFGGSGEFRAVFAPGSDSMRYLTLGYNLAEHGIYSSSDEAPYEPEQTIEPVYPLFLATLFSLGGGIFLVAFVQVLIAGVTTFFLFQLARLLVSSYASAVAALLFSFEPVAVYLSGAIFTETVFLAFFLAGVYGFLYAAYMPDQRQRIMVVAGLCIGIAALTRPEVQFLPAVFIVLLLGNAWYRGEAMRRGAFLAALFLAGFMLAVSPWLIRNKVTYGSWQTSSIGIHKVYLFDAVYFYSHQEGVSFKEARAALRERVVAISPYGNDDPTFANAPYLQKVTLDYIKKQPIWFALFYTVKTLPFFFSDGLRYTASKFGILEAPTINISGHVFEGEFRKLFHMLSAKDMLPLFLLMVGGMFWFFINTGALLAIWYAYKNRHSAFQVLLPVALCVSLVVIFAFMSGPVSNPRLRFKAEPLMFVLAVYGFSQLAHARFYRAHAFDNVLYDNERKI